MRIDVTYAGEPPRVIETGGESVLSSSTMASSPEWRGRGLPVTAVMLRPRTDLVGRDGHGLVVELCAWSADDDGRHQRGTIADLGGEHEAPRLLFHVFRVWEVLPADEVSRTVDISIDGRIHMARVGDRLVDLTAYERMEALCLSQEERGRHPLDQRVLLVHERLRATHPGLSDAGVGDLYGLGDTLFSYATSLGAAGSGTAPVPKDGLDDLFEAIADCKDRNEMAEALVDAILDHPGLTLETFAHGATARSVELDDITELWGEAEGRLSDGDGWSDDPWDA